MDEKIGVGINQSCGNMGSVYVWVAVVWVV